MTVTVVFTFISVIVMLAVEGLQPFEELKSNPHPIIGLICIICAIIQPIMALLRPHPGTRFLYLKSFFIFLFVTKYLNCKQSNAKQSRNCPGSMLRCNKKKIIENYVSVLPGGDETMLHSVHIVIIRRMAISDIPVPIC